MKKSIGLNLWLSVEKLQQLSCSDFLCNMQYPSLTFHISCLSSSLLFIKAKNQTLKNIEIKGKNYPNIEFVMEVGLFFTSVFKDIWLDSVYVWWVSADKLCHFRRHFSQSLRCITIFSSAQGHRQTGAPSTAIHWVYIFIWSPR